MNHYAMSANSQYTPEIDYVHCISAVGEQTPRWCQRGHQQAIFIYDGRCHVYEGTRHACMTCIVCIDIIYDNSLTRFCSLTAVLIMPLQRAHDNLVQADMSRLGTKSVRALPWFEPFFLSLVLKDSNQKVRTVTNYLQNLLS